MSRRRTPKFSSSVRNMGDIINEMELIGRMQSLGAGHGANSEQIKMRSEVKMMESLASSKRLLALGKLEDPDHWTFGDGDQSSLSGDDGQVYREFWRTGGDYAPGQSKTMSQWSADCYNGDLDEIKAHLKREPRLVDRRESVLRKNGLFHVINGTRATGILKGPPSSARRYLACAKYLVEKGTPVECRTVTGSSPLMQCTGGRGNKYTLMIADYLLEVGADINARDRFGCTAIIVPTSAGNDLIVDWLLENGADVDVTDNNGLSPMQLVQSFPSFRKKFTAANLKKNKQERREAMKMGSYQVCVVCENPAEKRCSGCYVVWYCDIECQNKNWSEHKSQCKQTRKEYVEAGLKFDSTATNHSNVTNSTSVLNPDDRNHSSGKSHFVVKIQVPLGVSESSDLLVYNEKKSVFGSVSPREATYEELFAAVREKGCTNGMKGYFYAIWEKEIGLKINPKRIQPPESW